MAYAYWKNGKHEEIAAFDLFFRKNRKKIWLILIEFWEYDQIAFDGEYTIFAGLEECLQFLANYRFKEDDIDYLRKTLPSYIEKEFYDYLLQLNLNDMKIYALPEGKSLFFLFWSME